ncbi:hypothetical protein Bealeia2_01734 [Candidatus Bealeia paramacronuclearis]|nr:hypothetical protein [Candidatus Bealeia paramacronuclearis]
MGLSNVVTMSSKFQTNPSLFPKGTLNTGVVTDGTTPGPSIGDVSNAGLYVLDASLNISGVDPLRTRSVNFPAVGSLSATNQPFYSYSSVVSGNIARISENLATAETTQTHQLEAVQDNYDALSKVDPEEELMTLPDVTILMNFLMTAQAQVLEAKRSILSLTRAA